MRKISFEETPYEAVELENGALLSEHLTVENSPILFGCRTGICGTCSIEVTAGLTQLHSRTSEEKEFLELMCPEKLKYRLACQIQINADIKIRKVNL